jgi:hypothetical protein
MRAIFVFIEYIFVKQFKYGSVGDPFHCVYISLKYLQKIKRKQNSENRVMIMKFVLEKRRIIAYGKLCI